MGWFVFSLFECVLLAFGHGLPIWVPMMFLGGLIEPLLNGSNQGIWQAKVAPDLQGRVFTARRLIVWFTNPISPIIGGTLADFLLEPAMKNQASDFLVSSRRLRVRDPEAVCRSLILSADLA